MFNSNTLEYKAVSEYYCALLNSTPKHYSPKEQQPLRSIMTILEKVDLDPRTVGLFQTTTSLTNNEKHTKDKENERFNFSSIMEAPKRSAQAQEVGPMKKKTGGMKLP